MNKKTLSTRAIAYVALFIAMQLVLEALFKVVPGQPEGGSITLSLLPIVLASYKLVAKNPQACLWDECHIIFT